MVGLEIILCWTFTEISISYGITDGVYSSKREPTYGKAEDLQWLPFWLLSFKATDKHPPARGALDKPDTVPVFYLIHCKRF